jgi:DNA-binding HxlR family transcriptional regulator
MRSYRQFCGVARSLDVIGERWSLLIVRDLLAGPRRFTELVGGLPGIPRNLLADRLRALEAAGVVTRDAERYAVTERGAALRPVLHELIRWSLPLMLEGRGEDTVRGSWAGDAAEALFDGADLSGLEGLELTLHAEDEPVGLRVQDGRLRRADAPASHPDITIRGPLEAVMATLVGLDHAVGESAEVTGRQDRLAALRERVDSARIPTFATPDERRMA